MHIFFKSIFTFLIIFLFVGCNYKKLDMDVKYPNLPNRFNHIEQNIKVEDNWLYKLEDKKLIEVINKALNNNFELQQLAYDIKIKEQELITTNSLLYPSLDLNANNSKEGSFNSSSEASEAQISLDLQYDVDLWGKLSDSSKASNMNLLETKALYEEGKQELIKDVTLLYFEIIEANNLLTLYKKNLKTANEYYELSLSRYKQGITEALDTLLAKNSIFTQQSKITNLKTLKSQAIYKLEQLLGDYPKGELDINEKLPILKENIKVSIPSSIIERKASINAKWKALLAKNHQLAFTHKQRLPNLNIQASISNIKNDGLPSTWSLLAGFTAPLFNAGELKANEEIAYFELKKAELDYLNEIFNSFVEIESFIDEEKNLKEEYVILKDSKENAKSSLELAFNQYLRGIIEYTTVLNLQESFYNAQASLIQIQKTIIENRINLHKALGGDFLSKDTKEKEK